MQSRFRFIRALVMALGLLGLASTATASPRFFMVMFAAEGQPNAARVSHTFATFVREDDGVVDEEITISWMPDLGYFGANYSMPLVRRVPGRNYSLDETIALSPGRRISYWGPLEISSTLYYRAAARAAYLGRGQTDYKMIIPRIGGLREAPLQNLPGGAINCIMAVSDIAGYFDPGTAWGVTASSQVLQFFAPLVYDNLATLPSHHDVAEQMNLYTRIGR